MLNLASFVYFVNLTISFGFLGKAFTPGIQFYSLVLFFILALFRRPTYLRWLNRLIGKSEENVKEDHQVGVTLFKQEFSSLTDEEIQKKLKLSLSEDARIALQQLMDEKKITY